MKKFVVGGLLVLVFLLVVYSQDLWEKPGAVTEPFPTRVRRSISKKAGTKAASEKSYQFVYAKTACNIRRGPGTKYSITRKATKGERLDYISRKGNWYKLRVARGKPQEWVHKNVVIPPGESHLKTVR
jgi:uncharacterized protein YgiM (DUF1202 family)